MRGKQKEENQGAMIKFVRWIEYWGNKLPHPMYMFMGLLIIVMVLSAILSGAGVSVEYDVLDRTTNQVSRETVAVVNMLSKSSLQTFMGKIITNFLGNSAVQPIIVVGIFMAIAEEFGFFTAGLRKLLASTPKMLVTYVLCVVSVCCNICSSAGYILAITLGSIVYKAQNRNPLRGIMLSWACVGAGYTANLVPAVSDVTLASITDSLAPGFNMNPLSNWYYMVIITFVLSAVATILEEVFLTKLFPDDKDTVSVNLSDLNLVTKEESRGIKFAGIGALILTVCIVALCIPKDGFFRNAEGKLLPTSPLTSNVLIILCVYFAVIGICYGIGAGTLKKATDVPKVMAKGIASVSPMLVTFFVATQFNYVFNTSKLGTIIAVKGEAFLRSANLVGIPLMILVAFFCCLINLLMPSASTKYLVLAPILIPMLQGLGLHPAMIMLLYRIGDSCTNNMTPLSSELPMCLSMIEENSTDGEKRGIGTVISCQIPFSICFFITFCALMVIFHQFNLPLGPGM